MTEAQATVSERRRRSISGIWLVPIVALLLGLYMVVDTITSQGPEITIIFSSGEGLEANKTKIKFRSVEVGLVGSVGLADDLESVVVTARLDKPAEPLLREDTQFWVVRPRIGPGGVSGLGTLLSGGYIQLAPGTGDPGRLDFEGLETPPVTPAGTPGLHLKLVSDQAGSAGSGNPILYKGFRVGRIETAEFDVKSQKMHYGAFIQAPYDELVTSTSRFWDASGIAFSAGADGIEVQTASLESILSGGVAFGLPEGTKPGRPTSSGATFELHPNFASVNKRPYRYGLEYVLRFTQSVRGLQPGAPVEWRGIPIGQVERVLLKEMAAFDAGGRGQPISVLIRLEPGRLERLDSEETLAEFGEVIETAVANGLHASLSTGNILTGSLYVYFDMYPDDPPGEIGEYSGYPTLPTIAGGLEGILVRVSRLLDKLNALPVEDVVANVDRLLVDINTIVASEGMRSLPDSLDATLNELRITLDSLSADSAMQERLLRTITGLDRTLQSLRSVLETLDEQPNALIFSRDPGDDPEPPAGSP